MSNINGLIYAIWFPNAEDRSVYVGLTQKWRFEKRVAEHLSCANRIQNRIVYKWMHRRIQDGYFPEFTVLEVLPVEKSPDAEVWWQQHFERCGWNKKHQHGGDHQVGYKFTDDHKEKLSIAAKNRKRRPHSELTKQKMSDAWDEERHENHLSQVKSKKHREAVSRGLKRAYKNGTRKPNPPLPYWTCKCGRKMRINGKTQHLRSCSE